MGIEELRACAYWTEREGRAAIGLWRRSGKPLAAWARSVGLSRSRLAYWSARLEAPPSSSVVALAPVAVVTASARGAITIELRSGRAVHIEGAFEDETLARVIAIAERTC
jgi:hypothetical protein